MAADPPDESVRHKFKSVTTRGGDKGSTGLLFGGRVPKYHPRVEAYGTFDEANSAMGLARSLSTNAKVKEILFSLQKDLFVVGAELAVDLENVGRLEKRITKDDLERLESIMAEIEGEVEIGRRFVIPGDTPASAAMDVARTVVRRGERLVVQMVEDGLLQNDTMLSYINRLSDCLFFLARYEEQHPDVK